MERKIIVHLNNTGNSFIVIDGSNEDCEECFILAIESMLDSLPNKYFYHC